MYSLRDDIDVIFLFLQNFQLIVFMLTISKNIEWILWLTQYYFVYIWVFRFNDLTNKKTLKNFSLVFWCYLLVYFLNRKTQLWIDLDLMSFVLMKIKKISTQIWLCWCYLMMLRYLDIKENSLFYHHIWLLPKKTKRECKKQDLIPPFLGHRFYKKSGSTRP